MAEGRAQRRWPRWTRTSNATLQKVCTPRCVPCAQIPDEILLVVVVRFKAVGNAPIMKQNFYKITSSNRFQTVIQFLRKELGWKQGDALVSSIFERIPYRPHAARELTDSPSLTVHIHQPRILTGARRHRRKSLQGTCAPLAHKEEGHIADIASFMSVSLFANKVVPDGRPPYCQLQVRRQRPFFACARFYV